MPKLCSLFLLEHPMNSLTVFKMLGFISSRNQGPQFQIQPIQ